MNNPSSSALKKPNPLWLIAAFLVPLVGFILYVAQRYKVASPHWYLWTAVAGLACAALRHYFFPNLFDQAIDFVFHDVLPLLFGVLS